MVEFDTCNDAPTPAQIPPPSAVPDVRQLFISASRIVSVAPVFTRIQPPAGPLP